MQTDWLDSLALTGHTLPEFWTPDLPVGMWAWVLIGLSVLSFVWLLLALLLDEADSDPEVQPASLTPREMVRMLTGPRTGQPAPAESSTAARQLRALLRERECRPDRP